MDRSEAATTLLLWQVEGAPPPPPDSPSGDGDCTLVSLVEAVAAPPRPRVVRRVRGEPDFLRLDEERAIEDLRARVRALAPLLRPEERANLERRLESGLLPQARICTIRAAIERLEGRHRQRVLQQDLERCVVPPPPILRAVLLYSRDGRLLSSDGDASAVEDHALSGLISRGEAGSTWSLAQASRTLVGHLGARSALVAVFEGRPRADAAATLRVSVVSLEQRDRLTNALGHPGGHTALSAYVRAVRVLLQRNA